MDIQQAIAVLQQAALATPQTETAKNKVDGAKEPNTVSTPTTAREPERNQSLLDKIHEIAKQVIESGIKKIFENSNIKLKNLGNDLRNLGISVFDAVRKVYLQDLVQKILAKLGIETHKTSTDSQPSPNGNQPNVNFSNVGKASDSGPDNNINNTVAPQSTSKAQKNGVIDTKQVANANSEIAKTAPILEKIDGAVKQVLQSGLLDFLERGTTNCKELGNAFRNLVSTILQSIQEIYAQKIAQWIIGKLNLQSDPWVLSDGTRLDPNFGFGTNDVIRGSNASTFGGLTSSSISNGVNVAATIGNNFLNSFNKDFVPTGLLNTSDYGFGEIAGTGIAAVAGPQELANSLVNNTSVPLKIINITDPNEVGKYLNSSSGEKVMINWIKNNAGTVKRIMAF